MPTDTGDWLPTINGEKFFDEVKKSARAQSIDVRQCFVWSPQFKVFLDPTYKPSTTDKPRPLRFYEDYPGLKAKIKKRVREMEHSLKRTAGTKEAHLE